MTAPSFVEQWGPLVGLVGGSVGIVGGLIGAVAGGLDIREKVKKWRAERATAERERRYRAWCADAVERFSGMGGYSLPVQDEELEAARWGAERGLLNLQRHIDGLWYVRAP